MLNNANQELGHAIRIAERIIQLEGKPVMIPTNEFLFSTCMADMPEDPYEEIILNFNLKKECQAIQRYTKIQKYTLGVDNITFKLITKILSEELEHENNISKLIVKAYNAKTEITNHVKNFEKASI